MSNDTGERARRLAEKLRENLKRRKAQARARREHDSARDDLSPSAPAGPDEDAAEPRQKEGPDGGSPGGVRS